MPNPIIDGRDLVAICSAIRRDARMYTPGSLERKQLDATLEKLQDMNALSIYELVPIAPFPTR